MGGLDRLFIVHHCLFDRHSHAYGQARGWLEACRSRGLAPRLYVNRHAEPDIVAEFSAIPAFEYPTDIILDPDTLTRDLSDFITVAERFAADCGALDRDGIGGSDVMFVTFSSERDILGAALWLERLPQERRPTVAFLFLSPDFGWHIDPQRDRVSGEFSRARYAMRRLRGVLPVKKIVVLATTERLASLLRTILQHPCDVCALPKYFVDADVLAATDAQVPGRSTVFVAGEFRAEKGADLTVPVMLRLASQRRGLSFAVQVPDEQIAHTVREQLTPMANSGSYCRIDYGQLSHEVYQKRLLLSDILLLPYLWWRYALRASGVFAEAVGFGIVTVVPDRTWMSDMRAAGWGAGTVFAEPTVENIAAAVSSAIDAYPAL
ncbi:MAG: hypothetical protein ACREED_02950, partial [Stellaceae bacterium]